MSKRVPQAAKLTDEDLEKFVKTILPCSLTAMYSKTKVGEATSGFECELRVTERVF